LNDAGMSCVSKLPSLLRLLNEFNHGGGRESASPDGHKTPVRL
jgi:hypothetical protein